MYFAWIPVLVLVYCNVGERHKAGRGYEINKRAEKERKSTVHHSLTDFIVKYKKEKGPIMICVMFISQCIQYLGYTAS